MMIIIAVASVELNSFMAIRFLVWRINNNGDNLRNPWISKGKSDCSFACHERYQNPQRGRYSLQNSRGTFLLRFTAFSEFSPLLPLLFCISQGLFLGSIGTANNKDGLKKVNVTHVLTVAGKLAPPHPGDFVYKTIDGNVVFLEPSLLWISCWFLVFISCDHLGAGFDIDECHVVLIGFWWAFDFVGLLHD